MDHFLEEILSQLTQITQKNNNIECVVVAGAGTKMYESQYSIEMNRTYTNLIDFFFPITL